MKRIIVLLSAAGLALGIVVPSWAVVPMNGVYQGIVDGSPNANGHNEGEGFLRVKTTSSGAQRIVPPGSFSCGGSPCFDAYITAPTYGGCNVLNANLEATKIPINQGAFDYKGAADIGPGSTRVQIRFKGAWVSGSQVKGFTRTSYGTCDSGKQHWTMNTPPP